MCKLKCNLLASGQKGQCRIKPASARDYRLTCLLHDCSDKKTVGVRPKSIYRRLSHDSVHYRQRNWLRRPDREISGRNLARFYGSCLGRLLRRHSASYRGSGRHSGDLLERWCMRVPILVDPAASWPHDPGSWSADRSDRYSASTCRTTYGRLLPTDPQRDLADRRPRPF